MDKRHIQFVNEQTVKRVEEHNKELARRNQDRARDEMGINAERGFREQLLNSKYTPERRQFI